MAGNQNQRGGSSEQHREAGKKGAEAKNNQGGNQGNSQSDNQGGNQGDSQSGNQGGSGNRGFAAMDPEQQRRITSEGGKASYESGRGHE